MPCACPKRVPDPNRPRFYKPCPHTAVPDLLHDSSAALEIKGVLPIGTLRAQLEEMCRRQRAGEED